MLTVEDRLKRLERSATRWRMFAIALLLVVVARLFIGADPKPTTAPATFDTLTAKDIRAETLTVSSGGGFAMLTANEAGVGLKMFHLRTLPSGEHRVGGRLSAMVVDEASRFEVGVDSDPTLLENQKDPFVAMIGPVMEGIRLDAQRDRSTLLVSRKNQATMIFTSKPTEGRHFEIDDAYDKLVFKAP